MLGRGPWFPAVATLVLLAGLLAEMRGRARGEDHHAAALTGSQADQAAITAVWLSNSSR